MSNRSDIKVRLQQLRQGNVNSGVQVAWDYTPGCGNVQINMRAKEQSAGSSPQAPGVIIEVYQEEEKGVEGKPKPTGRKGKSTATAKKTAEPKEPPQEVIADEAPKDVEEPPAKTPAKPKRKRKAKADEEEGDAAPKKKARTTKKDKEKEKGKEKEKEKASVPDSFDDDDF